MLVMARRFDNHVIDVYFNAFAHQMTKDFFHQSLVGCSGVFEAKWHNFVTVIGVFCDESGFVHVGCNIPREYYLKINIKINNFIK